MLSPPFSFSALPAVGTKLTKRPPRRQPPSETVTTATEKRPSRVRPTQRTIVGKWKLLNDTLVAVLKANGTFAIDQGGDFETPEAAGTYKLQGDLVRSLSIDWRSPIHSLVVKVSISDLESARKGLEERVVPRVSQAPGFVAGYWTWSDDRTNGQSMLVFDSQDNARAVAERIRDDVPEGVTVEGTEVREVVASA